MPSKLWKPMLAAKPDPDDLDAVLAALPHPALWSPKLDGIRATVQNGKLYSRTLKLIPNKEAQKLWGHKEFNGLDGEIVVGPPTAEDCFNRSTSVVMSRDKSAKDAKFHVFDTCNMDPYELRYDFMLHRTQALVSAGVISVVHLLIESADQLVQYERTCLERGYEGVMRRSEAGLYKHGRSTVREQGLIAVKRFVDAEAVIVDTYEQMENTNQQEVNELGKLKRSSHKAGKVGKDTLGGFVVRLAVKDGDKACNWLFNKPCECHPIFNIGTGQGLTDAVRKELWAKRSKLNGKLIKFRYQKIGTMIAPRQPIFLGFRDKSDL